jgi:hypothetical protein
MIPFFKFLILEKEQAYDMQSACVFYCYSSWSIEAMNIIYEQWKQV